MSVVPGAAVSRTLGVTLLAVLLLGCSGPEGGAADDGPGRTPTPATLEGVDLSGLPVARAPFCDTLDADRVEELLGGPVTGTNHYGNGDEAELVPGFVDVSHEYNCTFHDAAGDSLRAWVFAKPVTEEEAARLVRGVRAQADCSFPDGLSVGTPSVTEVCTEAPRRLRVAAHGLLGDAWLSCELTTELPAATADRARADALARTERWCVEVVTTLGARP